MAKVFYFDASALIKKYTNEQGFELIHSLFGTVPRPEMICPQLCILEVFSALVRKKNAGYFSKPVFDQVVIDFRSEVIDSGDFRKVAATDLVLQGAFALIEKHSINATDGVILASALEIDNQLHSLAHQLVLVSSDQRLLKATQAEGLLTFDPETQSQADLQALLAP
jgi:predicted nucleic acid-binding protein